ncbi:hypothetical protein CANINC_001847 [Pichia inconspicua]|uniref:peptidylprolyl isomerase n=1 Tax=Pichia inconspicua TaxID=52247 RepID=A0A4T0X339_9ASCO|nr:hypothetical protein CANINC_001847 [[Candida] inconspicua]
MSYVYFDIVNDENQVGRVVIQLFTDKAPKTCTKFAKLCESKEYSNVLVHKVIRNFIIQTGDTTFKAGVNTDSYPDLDIGKNGNGSGESIEDENLSPIEKPFLVCMSNFGIPNNNKSQFFITVEKCPHLNNKHTVFGKVIHGKSVIREIERTEVFSNKNNDNYSWMPKKPIILKDCGLWNEGDELPNYVACVDPIGGDIYEEYPDDNEIEGVDFENAEQSYKITSTIKESATQLFKQKRYDDALLKYKKSLRYCNELIPDDESNKEMFKKFQELKKTIYLNLTLVTLNLGKYDECINYCGYVLQMEDVDLSNIQLSKVFYRLGKSYAALKKYDIALETLEKAKLIAPEDAAIKREFDQVHDIVSTAKKEEKAKYAKFFS